MRANESKAKRIRRRSYLLLYRQGQREREREIEPLGLASTYRTTRLVIVQIHLLAQIATTLAGIDKFAREFETESDVVRAAAPLPIPYARYATGLMIRLRRACLMTVVAGAGFDGALAAGTRNRVGHSGAGDRIDEARFAAACK